MECLADVIVNDCLAINLFLADVIAIYHFEVVVIPPGQMLKPVLFCGVDIITTCFMLWLSDLTCFADVVAIDFCDWCYCHSFMFDVVGLADVVPCGQYHYPIVAMGS